jgi:hypothetical protein
MLRVAASVAVRCRQHGKYFAYVDSGTTTYGPSNRSFSLDVSAAEAILYWLQGTIYNIASQFMKTFECASRPRCQPVFQPLFELGCPSKALNFLVDSAF